MKRSAQRHVMALAVSSGLLASCGHVEKMSEVIQSTVAAGTPRPSPNGTGDLAATNAPSPASASAAQIPVGPTPVTNNSRTSTQRIPGAKQRITSVELDKNCERLVVPFDISVNASVLAKVAAETALPSTPTQRQDRRLISQAVQNEAALMNWLPMSVEVSYGERQHEVFVSQGQLLSRTEPLGTKLYPAADKLLAKILEGVGPQPYSFRIFVRKANDDNAVALAGGFVYVDASLLEPKKSAEAHFSVAHELGHVLQRHETRATQARLLDTISLGGNVKELIGAMSDPMQISGQLLKTAVAGKVIFQRHFESQELQADACAVRILDQSSLTLTEVDNAITAFLKSLPPADDAKPSSDVLSVLAAEERHPTTKQRRDNLVAVQTVVRQEKMKASAPPKKPAGEGSRRPVPTRVN